MLASPYLPVRRYKPFGRLDFLFLCSIILIPSSSWAVRPMSSSVALAAGEGLAGFRDGPFTQALFKTPLGLAINSDGTQLFVADSGNNRIRVIHLDQDNLVTTLAGQDKPGKQDGSLNKASFKQPHSLAYLPGNKLVVNDYGNKLLRLVDLNQGTVSTLAGSSPTTLTEGPASQISMAGVLGMAYLPSADSLFFTQPDKLTLKRLDLKTGQVTVMAHPLDNLPRPAALCAAGDKLYVADRDLQGVYELEWMDGTPPTLGPTTTTPANVYALAQSGDHLYALQGGLDAPLQRLLPHNEPVTFMSVWGDVIPQPGLCFHPVNCLNMAGPIGFVADPTQERKLYFVNPFFNMVVAFRDLYGNHDLHGNASLIEPPARKPPRTFRILLVGDSRSVEVTTYPFKTDYSLYQRSSYPPQVALSKRLELELNTLAALDNVHLNFEVLSLNHSATEPLFLWPNYEVPQAVSDNDVDLVLILQPPTVSSVYPFKFYFMNPMTKEGIPLYPRDVEYLMKPPQERIPDGEPRHFYDLCKDRHLVSIEGHNFVFDEKLFLEPQIHDSLVQLYGKPIGLLVQKLSTLKTSSGQPVRLLLCSAHTGVLRPNLEDPQIWVDAAQRYHVPFLDLNDEMTAMALSYFPLSETGGNDHLVPEGHLFFSLLLARSLIHDNFIPWNAVSHP